MSTMDNQKLINQWREVIIKKAEKKLHRKLTNNELKFINSRSGFIALEMIEETVTYYNINELERYLNSESDQ